MSKISIIMSVYNGEAYLVEAIESVLQQTYTDFEFIIIDDMSTDGSAEILRRYALKDQRIVLLHNEKNIGLTRSLNRGIAIATGEYIARMDADDISLSERLGKQVAFLDEHPNIGVVGTGADVVDAAGIKTRTIVYPGSNEELQGTLIKYNPFFHSSIMMRRSALETVGLYNEAWRFAQDYELILRIAQKYQIANLKEVLIRYREIPGSITAKKNRKQIGYVLRAKIEALRRQQFPMYKAIYLFPTVISWLLPVSIKRYIKNIVRK